MKKVLLAALLVAFFFSIFGILSGLPPDVKGVKNVFSGASVQDLGRAVYWQKRGNIEEHVEKEIEKIDLRVRIEGRALGVRDIVLAKAIAEGISILPAETLAKLNGLASDLLVVMAEYPETQNGGLAKYDSGKKKIVIARGYFASWPYVRDTVHELGHAYHFIVLEEMEAFKDFGGEKPPTRYGESSHLEDFADTFMLFFLDPDLLRQRAPMRYQWMEREFNRSQKR